jgi:hypothetical protein
LLSFCDGAREHQPGNCRGAETNGNLKGIGKATVAGCASLLHELLALSHQVDLQNDALSGLLRAVMSLLTAPALVSLHAAAMGALPCAARAATDV